MRIVYISGRYRHYLPNGEEDWFAMGVELEGERAWACAIGDMGCAWLAPLCNSVHCDNGRLSGDGFIKRDVEIIKRLRANYDLILMRSGWDDEPESVGARAEYEAAIAHGLEVLHGMHGFDAAAQRIAELEGPAITT